MIVKIAAISGLVILESIALLKGMDGAFLLPVACIIAGLAGYEIRLEKEKKEHAKIQSQTD